MWGENKKDAIRRGGEETFTIRSRRRRRKKDPLHFTLKRKKNRQSGLTVKPKKRNLRYSVVERKTALSELPYRKKKWQAERNRSRHEQFQT